MGRIIFGIAVLLFIAMILRWLAASRRSSQQDKTPTPSPELPAAMTQCAYCGVHFPSQDAMHAKDGRAFCSAAHLQLAQHA